MNNSNTIEDEEAALNLLMYKNGPGIRNDSTAMDLSDTNSDGVTQKNKRKYCDENTLLDTPTSNKDPNASILQDKKRNSSKKPPTGSVGSTNLKYDNNTKSNYPMFIQHESKSPNASRNWTMYRLAVCSILYILKR